MISLVIGLIALLLVFAGVWWLIGYLALPDIIRKIVVVVFVLILLVWLLSAFGVIEPIAVN